MRRPGSARGEVNTSVMATTLLNIGQFSRMTHLSVKALRHYHDVGILEPAAIDPYSGYRSYEVGQVTSAQVIRRLRDLGMPLDSIRAVLTAPGPAEDVDRTYGALGIAVAERAIGVDGPIREYYRSLTLSDSERRPAGGRERSSAAWPGGRPRRPVAVFRHRAVAAAKPSGNPPSLTRVRRGGTQGAALTPRSIRSRRCHTCPSAHLRAVNATS